MYGNIFTNRLSDHQKSHENGRTAPPLYFRTFLQRPSLLAKAIAFPGVGFRLT